MAGRQGSFESTAELTAAVTAVGPWFHQIDLPHGVRTRDVAATSGPQPKNHPIWRWELLAPHLPEDMSGMRVLDIGCADGFFSIEMARRGASVLAMDLNAGRVQRVEFASEVLGLDHLIEPRRGSIDDVDDSLGDFDLVLFLALLYHLHDPYGGLKRLVPRAPEIYLSSAVVFDPRPYFIFEPVVESHQANPKLFPTTGCVEVMLETAGCRDHHLLDLTGPSGQTIDPATWTAVENDDLSKARRVRAMWHAMRD
ncbi:MAG: DUF1698 domain-containing protein [Actinomycetia bacterium]|nr:DUF1698 domain-containing protein [Actinomycetes bacterium]